MGDTVYRGQDGDGQNRELGAPYEADVGTQLTAYDLVKGVAEDARYGEVTDETMQGAILYFMRNPDDDVDHIVGSIFIAHGSLTAGLSDDKIGVVCSTLKKARLSAQHRNRVRRKSL